MKRFWQFSVAMSLGLISAQHVSAQYQPSYNQNTGPSFYAVPPQAQVPGPQMYLTSAQDTSGAAVASPEAVSPVPVQGAAPTGHQPLQTMQQYAPVSIAPPNSGSPVAGPQAPYMGGQSTQTYGAPQADYQQQPMAAGCSTCGPVGDNQSYFQPIYNGPTSYNVASPASNGVWGEAPQASYFGQSSMFGGGYGGYGMGYPGVASPWFFGGGVLIFQRIDDYNRLLTVDDAGMPLLYTENARLQTMPGFEVFGGRYFNCGRNAISFSYWGLFPDDEMASVFSGQAGLRSSLFRPLASSEFQITDGANTYDIYDLYDNAAQHRIARSSTFNNVEINLLGFSVGGASRNFNMATRSHFGHGVGGYGAGYGGGCGMGGGCGPSSCGGCGDPCGQAGCGSCGGAPSRYATGPCGYVAPPCGSRLNFTWLAGVRYFQFSDDLQYQAIGLAPPALAGQTLSYDVYTQNHLVGFQVGNRLDYCLGSRVNLYVQGRTGIYSNRASLDSRLGTELYEGYETGMPAVTYNLMRSTTQFALLSELGSGLGFRITPRWSATAGYRVLAVSGVATAVGNLRNQGNTIGTTNIHAKDCLILHGVNIGATYNF